MGYAEAGVVVGRYPGRFKPEPPAPPPSPHHHHHRADVPDLHIDHGGDDDGNGDDDDEAATGDVLRASRHHVHRHHRFLMTCPLPLPPCCLQWASIIIAASDFVASTPTCHPVCLNTSHRIANSRLSSTFVVICGEALHHGWSRRRQHPLLSLISISIPNTYPSPQKGSPQKPSETPNPQPTPEAFKPKPCG